MMRLMVPWPFASSTFSEMSDARRDARLLAVRVVAVAGDDAGDVRAVAVVVVRQARPLTKSTNFATRWLPYGKSFDVVGQVVVPARDARVDDRDADAGAVVAVGRWTVRAPTVTAVR